MKTVITLLALAPMALQAYTTNQGTDYNSRHYVANNENGRTAPSDQHIREKINDELTNTWFSKKYTNVKAEVSDGQVTLTGVVDSQSDLKAVEDRIKNIPGIKLVRNHLQVMASKNGSNGQAGYQGEISDQQIRQRVEEELTNTWISTSYDNVKIEVNDGNVSLSGIVEGKGDLREVEDRIKGIPGVKVVRNQLQIMSSRNGEAKAGHQGNVSDSDIRKKVDEQLNNTWVTQSYPDVEVEVSEGMVTLKGIVDSEGDLEEVEERITSVPGVRIIRNRLHVQE